MKTVLITGASGGLGEYISKEYISKQYLVIGVDNNKEKLSELSAAISNKNFIPLNMDITLEEEWNRVIESHLKKIGNINYLINAAGILTFSKIEQTSIEQWNRTMAVNATGTFLAIKKIIQFMTEGSSIVNISSIASFLGSKDRIAYAASKGAVAALTKAASIELAPKSIRVNSVHPAYIQTKMAKEAGEYTERTYKEMGERIPLYNRISKPKEVGDIVLFLNSEKANFVTGAEIVVDGGQSVN